MSTESSVETAVENRDDDVQVIGWTVRACAYGLLVRQRSYPKDLVEARPIYWNERDEWLALSISMGLNARDVVNFSYCWPRPITTVQQVYAMIERLGLQKAYKKAQRTRSGLHNRNIAYAFTKLAGQAMSYGYDVTEVLRDTVPDERVKFRPDLGLKIQGKYQFFVEVQLSRIQATRWGVKFRNHLRLYEKTKKPFRALFIVDRSSDITRLRQYARDMLRKDHPNLNLFLFMTLDQFRYEADILKTGLWLGSWDKRPISLIQ